MALPAIDDNLLVAYADGELDPALAEQVEAEIAMDQALQARVAMLRQSETLLMAAFAELELPAPSRALRRLTDRMMLQSRLHTLSRWALPIAAAILGFVAGATNIRGHFRDSTYIGASLQPLRIERVLEDIVDDAAIYGREQEPIVAPPAGSKDRIEAWLASRLKLGVKVPDLTARGLEFLGSRLMAVQGRPFFMLIYVNDKDERIGIGIGPYKSQSATALKSIEDDGVKAFGRLQDGFLYVIVGPAGYPQTQSLANELPALLVPR